MAEFVLLRDRNFRWRVREYDDRTFDAIKHIILNDVYDQDSEFTGVLFAPLQDLDDVDSLVLKLNEQKAAHSHRSISALAKVVHLD